MVKFKNRICIFGIGGFGRETLSCLADCLSLEKKQLKEIVYFMVHDEYYKEKEVMDIPVRPFSTFDPKDSSVFVAVGDPIQRKNIVNLFPESTNFATIIHPTAVVSKWVNIGEGSIITAGTILTCNINIGKHTHLNLHTTVGHDTNIGNFFTSAPGVNISGNCNFGHSVYLGTNSAIREGIFIVDNVTIGMGGIVVKDIKESGIYVGNPVKKIG